MADGVSARVSGGSELAAALRVLVDRAEGAVRAAVAESALTVESRIKGSFTLAHSKGTPTPARAGQPPAVVTGTLRRSVTTEGPTRLGFGTYKATVGPTVVYARVQELGGGPSRLPGRPYVKPVIDRFTRSNELRNRVAVRVSEAIRV